MQGNAGDFSAYRVGTHLRLGIGLDVYKVMGRVDQFGTWVAVNTPSVDVGGRRERLLRTELV
jgi:hypothetical protein